MKAHSKGPKDHAYTCTEIHVHEARAVAEMDGGSPKEKIFLLLEALAFKKVWEERYLSKDSCNPLC